MPWAIAWLQLASCSKTPNPLRRSRADSRAPAPPTHRSHPSLRAQGHEPRVSARGGDTGSGRLGPGTQV